MRTILAITYLRCFLNQLPHTRERIGFALFGSFVENDHGNVMHFAPSNAICREDIETPLRAHLLAEIKLSLGVLATNGGNRAESDVSTVRHPIHPIEFSEVGGSGINVDAGSEVRVGRRILGKEELFVRIDRKV